MDGTITAVLLVDDRARDTEAYQQNPLARVPRQVDIAVGRERVSVLCSTPASAPIPIRWWPAMDGVPFTAEKCD